MLTGIDVSDYQGVIDWQDVHNAGIYFAGIKATEGTSWGQAQFRRNWERSQLRGVRRIAYHFFHPNMSGEVQADFFHATVREAGRFGPGDCAMLDIEQTNGMSSEAIVVQAERFVNRFLSTTECGLYIYTGRYFWDGELGGPHSDILARCPLWDASWGASPSSISLWPHGAAIWQWTASQHVPGIVGAVDGDRFLGTVAQYNILAREGGRH